MLLSMSRPSSKEVKVMGTEGEADIKDHLSDSSFNEQKRYINYYGAESIMERASG